MKTEYKTLTGSDEKIEVVETQNRLRSPVVWMSIISQLTALLLFTGTLNVSDVEVINMGVALVLEILVTFGVFNNPKDKRNV